MYGEVAPDPAWLAALGTFDLAALENGGQVEDASDRFYSPATNTIQPGRSRKMDDGWETRRRRDRGNDWIRYRLAAQSEVRAVEIDTAYLKGNSAGWASLSVRDGEDGDWAELLPRTRLQPDTDRRFVLDGPVRATHVRIDIFPDGGISGSGCTGPSPRAARTRGGPSPGAGRLTPGRCATAIAGGIAVARPACARPSVLLCVCAAPSTPRACPVPAEAPLPPGPDRGQLLRRQLEAEQVQVLPLPPGSADFGTGTAPTCVCHRSTACPGSPRDPRRSPPSTGTPAPRGPGPAGSSSP
ncbi:allantoicase [Streptomyces griseomycini]